MQAYTPQDNNRALEALDYRKRSMRLDGVAKTLFSALCQTRLPDVNCDIIGAVLNESLLN